MDLTGYVLGNTTFAVEPTNRLTTLWGKNLKHSIQNKTQQESNGETYEYTH